MKRIHSKELRLALSQLAFILMLSLPLMTFPSGSVFARFIPDVIAFTCLGLWGLLTMMQKETRYQPLEINSLGLLALVWTAIVAAQYFSGLISTSASFTLMSLGYFLAMLMIGILVNIWVKAGYKTELFQSFLMAVLLAAVLNAIVIVIQSSNYIDLFIPMIEKGNQNRPGGFISQSNIAGSWLLCGLIALVFHTKDSEQTSSKPRLVNLCIMALLMYAINQTSSRIVVIEMMAVTAILFAMRKQFAVSPVWLLMPVWQTVVFLISYLAHQVADISNSAGTLVRMAEGQQARFDIYQGVINIIKDHPLWGIGWRQMQLEQISRPELDGVPDHAHNLFLQVQLELGVLGSVSLLVFLIYWLKQRHIWTTKDPVIAVGLLVCMVFGLHSMAEYPLWFGHSLFVFCVGVAFLAEKPLLRLKIHANVVLCVFALQLMMLAWIYTDHAKAYAKLEAFTKNIPVTDTNEFPPTWWFKTYDDYRELQVSSVSQDNYTQYRSQALQLTNYLTQAIPFHMLLKIYVFSNEETKSLGFARKICKMDVKLWQKIVAYHLLTGPQDMQTWILALPPDLKKCSSSETPF